MCACLYLQAHMLQYAGAEGKEAVISGAAGREIIPACQGGSGLRPNRDSQFHLTRADTKDCP